VYQLGIDGGKVRLRSQIKGVVIGGTTKPFAYYFIIIAFSIKLVFEDWVNSQRVLCPLFVWAIIGHDGYGILFEELAALLFRQKF